MTRLTTCIATAALVLVLGSTAHAQLRLVNPYPTNPGCYPTPRLGFTGHMAFGRGMHVNYVQPGTPAQWMGLERGDVIVRINGRRIRSRHDYDQALAHAARYRGGRVVLLVDNVRAHNPWFPGPHFATVSGQLIGFGHGELRLSARPFRP